MVVETLQNDTDNANAPFRMVLLEIGTDVETLPVLITGAIGCVDSCS